MWASLTCGGWGRRSPGGGSQLAPGSTQTSPALCGTRFVAADPTQRAALPEEQRVVSWDTPGPRGTNGVGTQESQSRGGLGGEQQNQSSGSLKTRAGRRCGTFRYWAALCMLQLWLCRAAWHSSVVTPCTIACSWANPPTHQHHLGPWAFAPPCPAARPGAHHLDLVCWPHSLWPVPRAAPLWQPSSGPQGWWLGPWVAVCEVGLGVRGSLGHRPNSGCRGSRGWGAGWGQQQGPGWGGRLLGALGLTQEALVALQVGRALRQQVVVGAADLLPITDNGQDTGAGPGARSLDHLGCGILGV